MKTCLRAVLVAIWGWMTLASYSGVVAQEAPVTVKLAKRQVIFLREGLESIYGNAIFLVENRSEGDASLKTVAMLPKETTDFAATEGIDAQDIKLDGSQVVIERLFPPGVHVVGIGFQVRARFGRANLSFQVTDPIESLSLLVPKDSRLELKSEALTVADASASPDEDYRPYINRQALQPGDRFTVEVAGLPEGRGSIWILAAAIAVVLGVTSLGLALWTRPKIQDDGTQAFLVN